MLILQFSLKNLNASLQVGDAVYARSTQTPSGSDDAQAGDTGANHYIGILRKIHQPLGYVSGAFSSSEPTQYDLYVDDSMTNNSYSLQQNDFIMFSKYSQTDGDVNGYYAKANFVNDSREKAELFAVSSEIVINSK